MKNQQFKKLYKRGISFIVWGSLLAAFIFGKFVKPDDYLSIIDEEVHKINLAVEKVENEVYYLSADDSSRSRLRIGKAQGYGGELSVGVQYNNAGIIEDIYILKDRETVSFISKLNKHRFFEQFPEKRLNDNLLVDSDVDAISGCTVSSVAFTNAIRNASYKAASKEFDLAVSHPPVQWVFGLAEVLVMVLIIVGILAFYLKKKWLRYLALIISVAIVGFHLNASLSISHFARLLLGFLPNFKEHFVWWALVAVSLAFPFFLRKNLYCFALCPFHAVETALIKISGFQLKLTKGFQKASKTISLLLLWIAFMLIFLSDNPTLGSYEPFALLFSLDGVGLQWYLLPAALIGALLVPDFYCRFFCPVGRTLRLILKSRTWLDGYFKKEKAHRTKEKDIKPLKKTA